MGCPSSVTNCTRCAGAATGCAGAAAGCPNSVTYRTAVLGLPWAARPRSRTALAVLGLPSAARARLNTAPAVLGCTARTRWHAGPAVQGLPPAACARSRTARCHWLSVLVDVLPCRPGAATGYPTSWMCCTCCPGAAAAGHARSCIALAVPALPPAGRARSRAGPAVQGCRRLPVLVDVLHAATGCPCSVARCPAVLGPPPAAQTRCCLHLLPLGCHLLPRRSCTGLAVQGGRGLPMLLKPLLCCPGAVAGCPCRPCTAPAALGLPLAAQARSRTARRHR